MGRPYDKVVQLKDEDYPELLREISRPPKKLYVKGSLSPADKLALAVVGTRSYTSYGKEMVAEIVPSLVKAGFTIVSGMARGIDTFAHRAALDAGGRTIAVLGCGVDIIYPAENREIYYRILDKGAVISEYPPGYEPKNYTFPERNRIISGISRGTLVVEAGERSGALITANFALDQNRDLFAVVGSAFNPASAGPNRLIKEGAIPVTSAQDILEFYQLEGVVRRSEEIEFDSPEEKLLYNLLLTGPKLIDELIKESQLPVATASSTLAMMEIKGLVKNMGEQRYRRI